MATTVITKGSIAVSGAVSGTTTGNATIYTCPANSYAIVQIGFTAAGSNGTVDINIGGRLVAHFENITAAQKAPTLGGAVYTNVASMGIVGPLYVGPGQTVATANQTNNPTVVVSGVQFTNT